MSKYQKILIAIDTFGEYQDIVDRAKAVAAENAEMSLLYVHEPHHYADAYFVETATYNEQCCTQAGKVLTELGQDLGIPPERQYVETGRPAIVIRDFAEHQSADLIAMGTHGRHGLQLILGSTANAVLHGAPCDVLAVRIKKPAE